MLIAIIVSLVLFLLGVYMVNKVGDYENIWGFFLYYGLGSFVAFSLIKIIMVVIALLL